MQQGATKNMEKVSELKLCAELKLRDELNGSLEHTESPQLITRFGRVDWFNDDRGYGFISCDSRQYFVHYSYIENKGFRSLKEGQKVKFNEKHTPRGWTARDVQICEKEPLKTN
jgi:CspA family cold shock protein